MSRSLKFSQAIKEATDICMAKDPSVFIMGLGVPDPKGIFDTTTGLQEIYGPQRVMDMPASENAMTGVAIGAAVTGMRPILTHQRVDFALLSMEQIINQAANWHYMFGGQMMVPIVIRMLIGRGWGQGPQHSQSLHAHFAHIPGLKVVMPATPYDAKGLLIASIEDNNPVIFMEHRWLYNIYGEVPEGMYRVELGRATVARGGTDLTIVATSYMVLEALKAAEMLQADGLDVEVIDVRTLKPLDDSLILDSVSKTGRVIAVDSGWQTCGFASEILALVAERLLERLKDPPRRVTLPDCPTPTSRALTNHYYPRAVHIVKAAHLMLGHPESDSLLGEPDGSLLDVPDPSFTGPF
jgi:acetoin:2,6-dichlorophenolindophenol oxidoreductase subunit beta